MVVVMASVLILIGLTHLTRLDVTFREARARARVESYVQERQMRQAKLCSYRSVVRVGGVSGHGRVFEAYPLESAHTRTVAPLLQSARDQKIGEASL